MESDGMGSRVESGRLKEIAGPRRRTVWGSGGQAQVGENLDDHRRLFDGGDDGQGAAISEQEFIISQLENYISESQ